MLLYASLILTCFFILMSSEGLNLDSTLALCRQILVACYLEQLAALPSCSLVPLNPFMLSTWPPWTAGLACLLVAPERS